MASQLFDPGAYKTKLEQLQAEASNLLAILDLEGVKRDLAAIDEQLAAPGSWSNAELSKKLGKQRAVLSGKLDDMNALNSAINDVRAIAELIDESGQASEDDAKEATALMAKAEEKLHVLRLLTYFSGELDNSNAIVAIHPGAGGVDAADFAAILHDMYLHWAQDNGYGVETLDYQEAEEAGIRAVTLIVSGPHAYGKLKCEKGVHRLVRLSPFDSAHRRHTSFASVFVLPDIAEEIEIDIRPEDLRVDTYRASGKGGQHVNRTDSAVRITHLPTNTVVSCQTDRSQIKNRESAMRVLRARLYDLEQEKQRQKLEQIGGGKDDIAWGSQIRSYVIHPYSMVKDHRTDHEVGDVQRVLKGWIDGFIEARLKQTAAARTTP